MRRFSAGDAKAWALCRRRAWFDYHPPAGLEPVEDPFEQLVFAAGDEHEGRVLAQFPDAVEATSPEHTQALMAAGVPVIYQPYLVDDALGVVGRPDFLLRAADNRYRPADAKLATKLKGHKDIVAQVATYRRLLGTIHTATVFLGNGEVAEVGAEHDPIAEDFLGDMRALVDADAMPVVHFSYSRCSACPYHPVCRPLFDEAGDLGLNPAVDARSIPGLVAQGIASMADLANADWTQLADVPYLKGEGKRRAIEQAQSLITGAVYVGEAPQLPVGNVVHFDLESDPLARGGEGEVYLWGLLPPPYGVDDFVYTWSDGGAVEDEQAWRGFLHVVEQWRTLDDPLVLVHYANFERTQIALYARRYGMEADPMVQWLLADDGPLLDLRDLMKAHFVLPVVSYGLKTICKDPRLVNFQWRLKESGSQWSVVRYHDFLTETDAQKRAALRAEILTYNQDDVLATVALQAWMAAQIDA